jgi:uncharacterized protein (DUF433 family)
MSPTLTKHIIVDDQGCAWIEGTPYKVSAIVKDKVAHGWSAEEISYQHYGELSLSQIYAALSYYYDHQAAFDTAMAEELAEYENLRSTNLNSPLRQKLRRLGKIR